MRTGFDSCRPMDRKNQVKTRHKDSSQENFPVGMMIFDKKRRQLIADYYRFARYGDDIADNPDIKPQSKIKQLDEMEDIFLGRKKYKGKKLDFISKLREKFCQDNLAFSLATDLLIAFRRDASGFDYQTWAQLTDYCKYSAATVGRFMLAIHNEHPSTYLPSASLCAALQIVNHVQDIKYDALVQKRIYIPSDIMKKFKVSLEDLTKDTETPELRKAIEYIMEKIRGMIKDGALLPMIIRDKWLKTEICIILSLTNIMIKKILKGDVLAKEIKLSKWDWTKGILSGCMKAMLTKTKTMPQAY